MQEPLPSLFYWTAFHEGIGMDVSSYYVHDSATLIDPMVPAEGLDWFRERRPERIVLTCRHHYRHSDRFVEEFGVTVHCNEAGLHEFDGGPEVEGFRPGETVAPGIRALEVNALSPDETALHVATADGAIALADGLVRWGDDQVGFVPDQLMGDDPEAVKSGLRSALARIAAEEEFDSLLFAHGVPIVREGRRALERFLKSG